MLETLDDKVFIFTKYLGVQVKLYDLKLSRGKVLTCTLLSIKLYLQKVLALYFSYNLFYSKVSFIINFLRRMDGSLHATIYNNYIHVNNY